jgi:hypothetical protein
MQRYDLAVMSTKGMTVIALRSLIEGLAERGVTVLVLHDFDKSGFSIIHTMQTSSSWHRFATEPKVIDLGLRMADIKAMQLEEGEEVVYKTRKNPRENLRRSGATEEECDFLVRTKTAGKCWEGKRVELNAMSSRLFVDFLERRLSEVGVAKLVPDEDTLERAYRRAYRVAHAGRAVEDALARVEVPDPPAGLAARLAEAVKGSEDPWDEHVYRIAEGDEQGRRR